MQEPVVGATSSNPLRVLSTLLLLLFTSIGAAQAEFIFAPSTPGGLPKSCHRRTARCVDECQALHRSVTHQRRL